MGLNVWTEYLMFKRIWYANPQAPNVPKTPEKTDRFYPLMVAPALAFVKEKIHLFGKFFIFRVTFNNINNKFNILEIEGDGVMKFQNLIGSYRHP